MYTATTPGRSRAAETSTLVMRRVRVIAAHERHMQHPRQLHIVHEPRAAGQQPRVLVARNARVNGSGASCWHAVTASTMC